MRVNDMTMMNDLDIYFNEIFADYVPEIEAEYEDGKWDDFEEGELCN